MIDPIAPKALGFEQIEALQARVTDVTGIKNIVLESTPTSYLQILWQFMCEKYGWPQTNEKPKA